LDNCKFHITEDERLVSKTEGKTNFRGARNSLMAWPDWPRPHIIRQIIRHCKSLLFMRPFLWGRIIKLCRSSISLSAPFCVVNLGGDLET